MSIFFQGGRVWSGGQWIAGGLRVAHGRIQAIGGVPQPGDEVIDVTGKHVLPGLVDMHCHLREPGFEYKETIATGTRAAAAGGFTSVACMANTQPVADNAAIIAMIRDKAAAEGAVHVYPVGAITKGLKGEEMAEMGDMQEAGAVAVSDDGKPVTNSQTMRLALEYARDFGLLVIDHCEDPALVNGGVMNEGYQSTIMGLRGYPRAGEEVMINRDILLAEMLHAPVHIAHVSTQGGVELVRRAKGRGVQVTAETAPHYFSATDEMVAGYNTYARVNPPLRTQADVEAVRQGLQDGTLDAIATDHAPHHEDEKQLEFDMAASGLIGFETAFALGVTHLVNTGVLTLEELVAKMSENPAAILGIQAGELVADAPADITVVDVAQSWTVDRNAMVSKSHNTPFHGHTLQGVVVHTLVDGQWVLREGVIVK